MGRQVLDSNDHSNHNLEDAENAKVYIDQNFFHYTDKNKRWRQEYLRCKAVEDKLVGVSKFDYKPIDYSALLERKEWVDQPLPDLKFMLDEAIVAAEDKYFMPIAIRVVLFLIIAVMLIFIPDMIVRILIIAIDVAVLVSLFITAQERQRVLMTTMRDTRDMIEQQIDTVRQINDHAKKKFIEEQDERIRKVESLLKGDIDAVTARMDEALANMALPFFLKVDIDLYNNIPLVKVWIPPRTIIPYQICQATPSGRVEYEDKDALTINKQYIELCAAIMIQVLSTLYASIPSFDTVYVWAISKYGLIEDECVITAKFDRQSLIRACELSSGLVAVQSVGGSIDCDTMLKMLSLKPEMPAEWGNVLTYKIRTLNVRINRYDL